MKQDWLVGCIEDLRRFSGISAILQLGSRRKPISEIQVAKRGIEPRTSCSASQELDHLATATPIMKQDVLVRHECPKCQQSPKRLFFTVKVTKLLTLVKGFH